MPGRPFLRNWPHHNGYGITVVSYPCWDAREWLSLSLWSGHCEGMDSIRLDSYIPSMVISRGIPSVSSVQMTYHRQGTGSPLISYPLGCGFVVFFLPCVWSASWTDRTIRNDCIHAVGRSSPFHYSIWLGRFQILAGCSSSHGEEPLVCIRWHGCHQDNGHRCVFHFVLEDSQSITTLIDHHRRRRRQHDNGHHRPRRVIIAFAESFCRG